MKEFKFCKINQIRLFNFIWKKQAIYKLKYNNNLKKSSNMSIRIIST